MPDFSRGAPQTTAQPPRRLRVQLVRETGAAVRAIYRARVERVLAALGDDALKLQAAAATKPRDFVIPCPDAPLVMADPRVSARLNALREGGFTLEPAEIVQETPYGRVVRNGLRVRV